MKITIKGTNLKLSDSLYWYIDKKINELEKFIEGVGQEPKKGGLPPVQCWVEVGKTTGHHRSGNIYRAEVQIKLPGSEGVRAESVQPDLYLAIDQIKDEIQRQLKRYKSKQAAKHERGARKGKDSTRYSENL